MFLKLAALFLAIVVQMPANQAEDLDVSLCDVYLFDAHYHITEAMEHKQENRDISVYNVMSLAKQDTASYLKCVDDKLKKHIKTKKGSK